MSGDGCMLPFAAFVERDEARAALLLNLVDPAIGGVLLVGPRGSGKSRLLRALAALPTGISHVTVPAGAGAESLLGSVDWARFLERGGSPSCPGILERARDGLFLLDDIHLLPEGTLRLALAAVDRGEAGVLKDGTWEPIRCSPCLAGALLEGEKIPPALLDRFGLAAALPRLGTTAARTTLLQRVLACGADPEGFHAAWQGQHQALAHRVQRARAVLARVRLPPEALEQASRLVLDAGCPSARAELALVRAARARASWEGRNEVSSDDILFAAGLALPHRTGRAPGASSGNGDPSSGNRPPDRSQADPSASDPGPSTEAADKQGVDPSPRRPFEPGLRSHTSRPEAGLAEGRSRHGPSGAESPPLADPPGKAQEGGEPRRAGEDAIQDLHPSHQDEVQPPGPAPRLIAPRRSPGGSPGRSLRSGRDGEGGPARGHRTPSGSPRDIDWTATVLTALPFQPFRCREGLALDLSPADLRERVRRPRRGRILLFLWDASGSMGAGRRLEVARRWIDRILEEAYRGRDRVALMAFRQGECRLALPLTRSVDLAGKRLRDLPMGGRTPLALALRRAGEFVGGLRARDPESPVRVLLFTDGRANETDGGMDPREEVRAICRAIAPAGIPFTVVDSETGLVRLGLCRDMARILGAEYHRLEEC